MSSTVLTILDTLRAEFSDAGDPAQVTRLLLSLLLAALPGGVLGCQRERHGKAAGVRAHMLVALGAALFVLVPQPRATAVMSTLLALVILALIPRGIDRDASG